MSWLLHGVCRTLRGQFQFMAAFSFGSQHSLKLDGVWWQQLCKRVPSCIPDPGGSHAAAALVLLVVLKLLLQVGSRGDCGAPRRVSGFNLWSVLNCLYCLIICFFFLCVFYILYIIIYIHTLGKWFAPENTPDLQMSRRDRHSMDYKLCKTSRKDSLFPTKLTSEDTLGIHWDVILDIFRYRQMPYKCH